MTSLVVKSKIGHDKASLQEVQPTSTQGDEASSPPQNVMKKRYNFRTLLGLSICVSATVSSVFYFAISAIAFPDSPFFALLPLFLLQRTCTGVIKSMRMRRHTAGEILEIGN